MSQGGWIGVDLDGTLAQYITGDGVREVGEPIPLMLQRVKDWLAQGQEVRIVTARVGPGISAEGLHYQMDLIQQWCEQHIGQKLTVTASKDFNMIVLYDDRCVQVQTNTGVLITEGL